MRDGLAQQAGLLADDRVRDRTLQCDGGWQRRDRRRDGPAGNHGDDQETDVNSTGKTIGFDDVNFTGTAPNTGRGNVALDIEGGFLYGSTIATTNSGTAFARLRRRKLVGPVPVGGPGTFGSCARCASATGWDQEGIRPGDTGYRCLRRAWRWHEHI